jgi:putative hydrolase of the HAD superfamily
MSVAPGAIVFDLDDTLFPEREYAYSGFEAVGAWFDAHFPAFRRGDGNAPGFAARAKALFEQGKRGKIFDETLRQYAFSWPEDTLPSMIATFREHRPKIALSSAVSPLLQTLRRRGFKLGVLTDGWLEVQKNKVAALGLAPLVDTVVYSDTWGRESWKPSPRPFREMETALGVRSVQCLYIGDNPAKDIPGAHGAGWQAWRLRIPGREHFAAESPSACAGPDYIAHDWPELETALRGLPAPIL